MQLSLCKRTLLSMSLFVILVQVCTPVCVDIPSETEAVLGRPMRLTCISCIKREEASAETRVEWFYITEDDQSIPIFVYDGDPQELWGPWKGRLMWNGSRDLQDLSITITRTTFNDSGTYVCEVSRQFTFDLYTPSFTHRKVINLVVREKLSVDPAAFYSELIMYAVLVFLTLWLLVEMVYCFRKISRTDKRVEEKPY